MDQRLLLEVVLSEDVDAVSALFPRRLPREPFFFLGTVAAPDSSSSSLICAELGVGLTPVAAATPRFSTCLQQQAVELPTVGVIM